MKKHRFFGVLACACVVTRFLTGVANAAEVLRSTSVFEDADQGSKQVLILKKGQAALVNGPAVERDGDNCWPVKVDGKSGWVMSASLRLVDGDIGYTNSDTEAREPRRASVRFWFGVGPSVAMTSGYSDAVSAHYSGHTSGGAVLSAGINGLLGRTGAWPLGLRLQFPWLNESAQGYGAGRITRFSLLPEFGYAIIPQRLELLASLGLTYIRGESPNFDAKLSITPGLTLAWQLSTSEPGALYQAVELGAYRMGKASGAVDLGLGSGLCNAANMIFGQTSPDPTCDKGIAPTAYVFTLIYKVGGFR